MTRIYGAYRVSDRSYYEDDGGGSSSDEFLIDADTNKQTLIQRVNEYHSQPKVINFYRGTKMVIEPKKDKSNSYSGSGGGCFASGYVKIKLLPTLEMEDA